MYAPPPLSLLPLDSENAEHLRELQRVLEGAPSYFSRISGHPAESDAAPATVSALPPGKNRADKFVYGVLERDRMIGCIDLVRAYPDERTAMLGLLLLEENAQGTGRGRAAYELLETRARSWAGMERILIAVIGTNAQALGFWERMGFVETGDRRPYAEGEIISERIVLEKKLLPL